MSTWPKADMGPTGCGFITPTSRGTAGTAGSRWESELPKPARNAIASPSQNMRDVLRRPPLSLPVDSMVSSGIWASGKVSRSCLIHCRWTSERRHRFARNSADRKEDQAARGTSHSRQGTVS